MSKGQHCGREPCVPCDTTVEKTRQDCRTRNLRYETYCLLCNPTEGSKIKPTGIKNPKIGWYLGETSRSLHERMEEHYNDARSFKPGSHILKHWIESHPALREIPPFQFRIIRTFKECLTRQVSEAIAIMLAGTPLLNAKCEYLTNNICRVTVEEGSVEKKKREMSEELAEKERLKVIDAFRLEKEDDIKGRKRKSGNQSYEVDTRIVRPRFDEPDYKLETTCTSIGAENSSKPGPPIEKPKMGGRNHHPPYLRITTLALEYLRITTLALEYTPLLSLEHCPKDENIRKTTLEKTTLDDKPRMKRSSTKSSNYILNLYGWVVWWERQESTILLSDMEKAVGRSRISNFKKDEFISRYFNVCGQGMKATTPRKGHTEHYARPEKSCENPEENSLLEQKCSSTPKRLRDVDNLFVGESPNKKIKSKSRTFMMYPE